MKRPRRALALALGLGVGSALVGLAEVWQRSREAGPVQLVHDPPGLKYALAEWEPDRSRGWHEGRDTPARTPGTTRIVAVGDSITYGVHVSPRETWPARLADLLEPLAEQRSSRLEVSNFGVNGYDVEQVASLVTHRLTPWKPDLVIWAAYVND
ncbi:MAG: SGNH/GDSL hydrolase family protein, partial [Myxococcota bacterium]|nr:SGNH/GDSL hydrolase family protein [Myxococcota bacterium]